MLLVPLLACQEPFPEDRHDLSDFRIVAMTGTEQAPAATLWSAGGLWHQPLPTLQWSQDDDGAHLLATDAEGHSETGSLRVENDAAVPTLTSFTRVQESDGTWTIDLDLDQGTTHFMARAGTFTESGPTTTAWDPEDTTGIVSILALSFDGRGGNRLDVIDLPVGIDPPWLEVGGRIFPYVGGLDGSVAIDATLVAADDDHGVALDEVALGDEGERFDLDDLGRAAIARDDTLGLRVHLDATAVSP